MILRHGAGVFGALVAQRIRCESITEEDAADKGGLSRDLVAAHEKSTSLCECPCVGFVALAKGATQVHVDGIVGLSTGARARLGEIACCAVDGPCRVRVISARRAAQTKWHL